jgi:plastocyanin
MVVGGACDKDTGSRELVAPESRSDVVALRSTHEGDEQGFSGHRFIAIRDDCDPNDPGWAPTGGCLLKRGDVTLAEFNAELNSALAASVVGHQAWRNDPSYLKIESGKNVRVANEGGRVHTFTEVAQFGGGRVPPLSRGLVPAPECAGAMNIPPGERIEIDGLAPGNHRFQCCIHPWMRALIKVEAEDDHSGH